VFSIKESDNIGYAGGYRLTFQDYPLEHEVYTNLSLYLEGGGKFIKFLFPIGCVIKANFINYPDSELEFWEGIYDTKFDHRFVITGNYQFFSIGGAAAFGVGIYNKRKNFKFSFYPLSFHICAADLFNRVTIYRFKTVWEVVGEDAYLYLKAEEIKECFVEGYLGFEFSFSFNYYKTIK